LREILCSQVDDARTALRHERLTDRSVHDVRKLIKRARATLRLLHDAMPKATYRHENTALRDAAHPLSARRDASTLLKALAPLATEGNVALLHRTASAVRKQLKLDRRRITRATPATSEALEVDASL
jgi:hypothetical protein